MLSLSSIWKIFTKGTLYVQLKHSWLSVREVGTDSCFEHDTTVVMEGKKVIGFADDSFSPHRLNVQNLKICNGFDHPRILVRNFDVSVATLHDFIVRGYRNRLIRPDILFHVREELEGGVTDIELKVITDLCLCGGARRVMVSTRPEDFREEELITPNGKDWIDLYKRFVAPKRA